LEGFRNPFSNIKIESVISMQTMSDLHSNELKNFNPKLTVIFIILMILLVNFILVLPLSDNPGAKVLKDREEQLLPDRGC